LSSSERAIRHGELKHLKHLKYELKNESKGRQRKQLKYDMFETGEDKLDSKTDLRDVEFRIANDFKVSDLPILVTSFRLRLYFRECRSS